MAEKSQSREVVQKNVPKFRMREEVWLSEDENNGNSAKDALKLYMFNEVHIVLQHTCIL
jgi:hypothetical protein